MFSSWLHTNQKGFNNENKKHAVLGSIYKSPVKSDEEEIFFACGCFWGAEKGFWKLPGVTTTAVGYAGGEMENPTYKQICTGQTGHAEVVRVVWKNSLIDLSDLLKLFWECHDPTQGNRQGNDQGSQYRSAIFTNNKIQQDLSIASRNEYQIALNHAGFGTITTEIKIGMSFYYAEEYHQQYLARPGSRPYCSAMPSKVILNNFPGANFKLKQEVWKHFDWSINHCVLRSNNEPIKC